MFRWQTLTLARLEVSDCPRGLIENVKLFLLRVGLPHFMEPYVGFPPTAEGDAAATLTWEVDNRELYVTFKHPGNYSIERREDGENRLAPPYITADAMVRADVHWLLFGTEPPASLDQSTVPRVGQAIQGERVSVRGNILSAVDPRNIITVDPRNVIRGD